MIPLVLSLTSALMLGIGCVFTWIELRSRIGPQFRYFSTQLLLFPALSLVNQGYLLPDLSPQAYLFLTQVFHVLCVGFIFNSIYFMSKILALRSRIPFRFFQIYGLVCLPLIFTPWMFEVDMDNLLKVLAGPIYFWTIAPYVLIFVFAMYYYLALHVRLSPKGSRKFPVLHLLAWILVSLSGLMNMFVMIFPQIYFPFIDQAIPISLLLFGSLCGYFFADQFFHIWDERSALFSRIGSLSGQLARLEPMGRLGESTAHVSHEIKNYIGILKANNSLLFSKLNREDVPEIERIARSTERLEQFARSILDYSQGSTDFIIEPLALHEMFRETIRIRFPELEKGVQIFTQGSGRILGDPVRLERVFINLVLNSLQAGATKIWCSFEDINDPIKVTLEDNGTGCSQQEIGRLGSPFFTTKKDAGGTGLGLAMAASIIRGHGGAIRFSQGSNSDRGLRVTLSFPRPKQ